MKLKTIILSMSLASMAGMVATSCDDMLDKGNDYVIYADDRVLGTPSDTATSVMGILNKLQGIAVRQNLLGELRADLAKVRDNAKTDLKDIAEFNIGDDNAYNNPRDYYAVINNCNFFLARADSTAGNANRNEKYFEAEIAQVHSIRAWVYLELAKVYGRVPLVTEPILTKLQSEAQYPMYDLGQICDYFIDDLKPYYGKEYPGYRNIGANINPQLCFFPSQVVMGDLYLWRAAISQNPELAKKAAKSYYDYIMWDLGGKVALVTGSRRASWPTGQLDVERYHSPTTVTNTVSGDWGKANTTTISAIPMDSLSSDGYYNELRTFYNTTATSTKYEEACIEASSQLKELSDNQVYMDYDKDKNIVTVTADKFTDKQIENGYYGDLRYQSDIIKLNTKLNSEEVEVIYNYKHSSQHVGIYRAHQIYLRLAEALNYAGYPRFARQILTMGLSNNVINYEVLPYYRTKQDSAFIQQFDFNTTAFKPYAENYSNVVNKYGMVTGVKRLERADAAEVNMIGIHSRGCGLAFLNEDYLPLAQVDSTAFPFTLMEAIGDAPTEPKYQEPTQPNRGVYPSTWETNPQETLTLEEYIAYHTLAYSSSSDKSKTDRAYKNYCDSVAKWVVYTTETLPEYIAQYEAEHAVYEAEQAIYDANLEAFTVAYNGWLDAQYGNPALIAAEQAAVDQAILDEQALELAFEGNRYYDLMRRAYWWNDSKQLVEPISKRTSAATVLNDRTKWFLNWKNKIGY